MCHEHTGFDIPNILNFMANQFTVDVVQSLSHVQLFATPRTAARQTLLSSTIPWTLLKFMSIQSVMPSNHFILCCPFSFCLQSFPGSCSFSRELALHIRWPKYWSFRFSISPSNEYLGFISFRIGWFDLAVQGTLKSPLQHNSKVSVPQCSAFFMIQLSHPYMASGKSTALTVRTFAGKVMSLLFNMLSRLITGASLVA